MKTEFLVSLSEARSLCFILD